MSKKFIANHKKESCYCLPRESHVSLEDKKGMKSVDTVMTFTKMYRGVKKRDVKSCSSACCFSGFFLVIKGACQFPRNVYC